MLDRSELVEALGTLTTRQRDVVTCMFGVDGKIPDRIIADKLGVCRSAVTRRRIRAIQRLQISLQFCDNAENVTFDPQKGAMGEGQNTR